MQQITVLGSTGSIGKNTLDVIARHSKRFQVFALTASSQVDLMFAQCVQFQPQHVVMVNPLHAQTLKDKIKQHAIKASNGDNIHVHHGELALEMVASHDKVNVVMAAIVGAAGLKPCLAAAKAGKRLLLANKEALVIGGEIFLEAVRLGNAKLLPIDSEHSAIFQSLPENPEMWTWQNRIHKLILTASGGPFRTRDPQTLKNVTPEEACAHPNWIMGKKISVDSATMMNKALEVIEARYLFGLPSKAIEVVIHPQSIIHSMVQYVDMSIVAQLGLPDMRVPIAYGLSWPDRIESGAQALDFTRLSAMTFEKPDDNRFPSLSLAWQALEAPVGSTAVLNAANEVAVQAFLDRQIRFDQIHQINEKTLEHVLPNQPKTVNDLLELDAKSRAKAQKIVCGLDR